MEKNRKRWGGRRKGKEKVRRGRWIGDREE